MSDIYDLFVSATNARELEHSVRPGVNLAQTMMDFAVAHSRGRDETVSIQYLNHLYSSVYGSKKNDNILPNTFDVYDIRAYDSGTINQQTFRTNSNFRYNNQIPRWQQHGSHMRMASENTGLRYGDFQEAEGLSRGYDMSAILAPNRYN